MQRRITTALLMVALAAVAPQAVAESPRERAAKLIKKLATDKKAETRAAAAKELGEMGAADAVPALGAALKDPSADVRAGAAYALVKLKDDARDATPALKEALADGERTVRYNAVVALSNMQAATPAELAVPIRSLLETSDDKDRARAARMLVRLGLDDATARKTILEALEQESPEVRLLIMKEMWDQKTMERSGPGKNDAVAAMTRMVTADRDPKMRYQAIDRLREAKAASAPVGAALMKAIDDADPSVAREAVSALGDIYDVRKDKLPNTAIAHLSEKLKSTDASQRASAAHALGGFTDGFSREKVIPVLAAALRGEKEPLVRLSVVGSLGEFAADAAILAMAKALKVESDPKVKTAICTRLSGVSQLKMTFERTNTVEETLVTLESARGDADASVKAACEPVLTILRK
jgi:HEAT repeat protein